MYWLTESNTSIGRFFETGTTGQWVKDIWQDKLAGTPLPSEKRKALLAWHSSRSEGLDGDQKMRWLDSMSYKDYLERELGLGPEGTAESDYFMAASFGLGSDAISAYLARDTWMPGMVSRQQSESELPLRNSFPGGNSGYARYFLKAIKPAAIGGRDNFDDIITGAINFSELDKQSDSIRIRLGATAVSVQHEGKAESASSVKVVYSHIGKEYAIRAKGIVMASGGWVNKHVVRDLPGTFHNAYQDFHHAPFLVANVALKNWRFMYELGITGARWQEGFGYGCNIRQPMMVGRHRPVLDPDKPAILNFYVPFHSRFINSGTNNKGQGRIVPYVLCRL